MKLLALLSLLALMLQEARTASLPKTEREREGDQPHGEGDSYAVLQLGDYVLSLDNYDQVIDLSNYDELTDYRDQLPKVKGTSLASPTRTSFTQSTRAPRTPPSNPTMARPTTRGLLVSLTSHGPGLPTCLICVCLGSSVYCDDADLENIPPLPQTTAYLYARFNRIRHIRAGDFKGLTKLKRIDLSSNFISSIDDDALLLLPALQDLILPENKLAALPVLPTGIEVLDIRLNQLQSSGIQPEAFRALEKLQFLYLADNLLDSIPRSLPLSLRSLHLQNNMIETMQRDTFCDPERHKHTRRQLEDIRLDGNPINLNLFPSAYFCLPRLPTGRFT
uniref:Opticin n=1 Tax=Tursiops truncatus TaxID=9739 RepID=A0A2U4A0T2_TURTR|nr:opticin [Tursiops truncatus]